MSKRVTFALSDEVHRAFKARAGGLGVTMQGAFEDAVARWAQEDTPPPDPEPFPQAAVIAHTPPTLVKVLHPKNQKVYEVTEGLELQQALAKGYTLVEEKA